MSFSSSGVQHRGCCTYPQGRICIWATVSAVITYIACANVSAGCYYMRADIFSGVNDVYIGFGGYEQLTGSNYCVTWSSAARSTYFDGAWRTGLAFAVLATIFSGVAMIMSFFFACFSFDPLWIKICSFVLMMVPLFELLTFIAFASDICSAGSCKFSVGAGLAILGGVNACLTAGIFKKIQPYEEALMQPGVGVADAELVPETVQVTEQIFTDGTKKMIKTIVREDGSRKVEETVEIPASSQP